MNILQTVVLALIQGVTEFLPISSSAHLILAPLLTDWPDQGLAFDVALNTATWLAVVIYLRKDIAWMLSGLLGMFTGRRGGGGPEARLAVILIAATVPVAVAGFLMRDIVAGQLRTAGVIAWSSIIWGVVLMLADRRPGKTREVTHISWGAAIFIGLAQALALVPGTSRSGITMTAGLFSGFSRTATTRFSFLLAVPIGALAGAAEFAGMMKAGPGTDWLAVSIGFIVAFISAYAVIHYFIKFISRVSMTPFAIYRIALGVVLLVIF